MTSLIDHRSDVPGDPNGFISVFRIEPDSQFCRYWYHISPAVSVTAAISTLVLQFHDGRADIPSYVDGVTEEVLLAILFDRLKYRIEGRYDPHNLALAAGRISEALMWLKKERSEQYEASKPKEEV